MLWSGSTTRPGRDVDDNLSGELCNGRRMDASRIGVPPERRREEQPGSVSRHNVGIPHETVTAPDDLSPGAVVRVADASLPTQFGEFRIAVYQVEGVPDEIVALVRGDPSRDESPLVRLHSECLTGDV